MNMIVGDSLAPTVTPEPAPEGGLVYIAEVVALGSTYVDIENTFGDYDSYLIRARDCTPSTASSVGVRLKFDADYLTGSVYVYYTETTTTGQATPAGSGTTATQAVITPSVGDAGSANFDLIAFNPSSTTKPKLFKSIGVSNYTTTVNVADSVFNMSGTTYDTKAVTGIRFWLGTTSYTMSGRFTLYGIL